MPRRDNAGENPNSWKKHQILYRAARGQAHAYRATHPTARLLIIDMHAGDGEGVPLPQLDLFAPPETWPTPRLATRLAAELGNTDVVLCEKVRKKRQLLTAHFPDATVLGDHAEVPAVVQQEHRWALVFNDPCGYADQGVETLQYLATRLALDTLIVFNEAALNRLLGMQEQENPARPDSSFVASVRALRPHKAWMADQAAWAQVLGVQHMARTMLLKPSAGFHYRIFVLSHTLSQALRPPLWEQVL